MPNDPSLSYIFFTGSPHEYTTLPFIHLYSLCTMHNARIVRIREGLGKCFVNSFSNLRVWNGLTVLLRCGVECCSSEGSEHVYGIPVRHVGNTSNSYAQCVGAVLLFNSIWKPNYAYVKDIAVWHSRPSTWLVMWFQSIRHCRRNQNPTSSQKKNNTYILSQNQWKAN